MKCLECNREFKNQKALSIHIKKSHDLNRYDYEIKYGIREKKYCKICKCELIPRSGFAPRKYPDYCGKHYPRDGENNAFYGKTHTPENIEKIKKLTTIASKKLWKDPEYRKKVIKGTSKPRHPGFKKEQSERITQWYKDNPEQRKIRSDAMKKSWAEGKIEPNIISINESKLEKQLLQECKNIFGDYNVRKSTIRLAGKWFYPDIRIDKKIIIEFFGNYWHANPEMYSADDIIHEHKDHITKAEHIWDHDKKRIDILEDNDYSVYIVWEKDYKENKKQVLRNLEGWVNETKNQ